jgi:hypothetical protein
MRTGRPRTASAMSDVGTFQTYVTRPTMSARGGKADLTITSAEFRDWTCRGRSPRGAALGALAGGSPTYTNATYRECEGFYLLA